MSDDKLALNCQLRPEMDSEEFYIESQQADRLPPRLPSWQWPSAAPKTLRSTPQ